HRGRGGAECAEAIRRGVELWRIRGNQQIEPFTRTDQAQFEADARGGAGDQCKWFVHARKKQHSSCQRCSSWRRASFKKQRGVRALGVAALYSLRATVGRASHKNGTDVRPGPKGGRESRTVE